MSRQTPPTTTWLLGQWGREGEVCFLGPFLHQTVLVQLEGSG